MAPPLIFPQNKQVVGPGGFGAKIKKRTQSLMNYQMFLHQKSKELSSRKEMLDSPKSDY
jgi:hypothetical protein